MVKKCSLCYWGQERKEAPTHFGCFSKGKWKRWILKKQVDIPNDCPDFKVRD